MIIERIYLTSQSLDWIEDDSHETNWDGVGVQISNKIYLNGSHYEIHHRSNLKLNVNDDSFEFGYLYKTPTLIHRFSTTSALTDAITESLSQNERKILPWLNEKSINLPAKPQIYPQLRR